MTNDEAKFVLHAYRANGGDAQDPAFAEALAQAKCDPELAAWFRTEQAHAGLFAAKLREIVPPANLREAILCGARVGRRPARRGWRRFVLPVLAAAAALVIGYGIWWAVAPVPGATLDEFAANFVARRFLLQKRGPEIAELKAWLQERGGPLPQQLPAAFAGLQGLGCRTLEFEGQTVSLLCFEQDGHEYHVFVARRAELPGGGGTTAPLFAERRGLACASWSDETSHYVVIGEGGLGALRRLLGPAREA